MSRFRRIEPRRLRPTAEIYPDAILVGDPGRAMALAQVLIEQPKMCNHARGLWGYSGMTAAGRGLTVQSTGMGGPSAALVLGDLAALGVRRAVRIGTAAALGPGGGSSGRDPSGSAPGLEDAAVRSGGGSRSPGPDRSGSEAGLGGAAGGERRAARPGDLVEAREARAWPLDGRGAGPPAFPDQELARRLRAELGPAARSGLVASLDVLHPSTGGPAPDGDVADMQTAALFTAGPNLGVALAAVLIVTEAEGAEDLDDGTLANRAAFAGEAALRAVEQRG